MALIIGEPETRKLIDMPRALTVVERMFHDRAKGKVRSVPRRRLKGSQKQLNMMAAWQADWDLICLRAYAAAANTVTLYRGRTGIIQAIVNCGYLSSLRTGAASGVAAKYLAPAGSETIGLIGPGWQATFQLEAILPFCPVKRILVFGRHAERRTKFIREMRKKFTVEFGEVESVEEIETRSDIVVLATDSSTPLIHGSRLKDEVLVVTMGANQAVKHEVSGELIQRMDLVVTDDLPTAQTDSGDLIDACKSGLLGWEDIVPLERVVAGGRFADRPKRILFQSNGIADEDLAVCRDVVERAKRKKLKLRRVTEI